jgi:hypothetical protein
VLGWHKSDRVAFGGGRSWIAALKRLLSQDFLIVEGVMIFHGYPASLDDHTWAQGN